jgi:subtilisin family serine protease
MHARIGRIRSFSILIILLTGLLLGAGLTVAQEATPTEVPPPEATTVPTDLPTDVPTEAPPATEVAPTLEPTVEPTVEQPTAEPTQQPTDEAGSTLEPTIEPTVTPVQLPPAFSPLSEALEVASGQALVFNLSVSDESGAVRVLVDSTGTAGAVSVEQVDPVESIAPYLTSVTVTYVPAAGFSGVDRFSLIAVDPSGLQTSIVVDVNVNAEVMTPTPLPTATAMPTAAPGGTHELVINFNPNASPEAIAAMLASLNAVEVSRIPAIGAMKVLVPDQFAQPAAALAAVNSNISAQTAGVTMIEPNIQWSTTFSPNDPAYVSGNMPGLNGTFGIYANLAWDIATTRGMGVTVAVIDSGIQASHPDLIGQTVPGYDFVFDDATPDDQNGHGTHVAGTIAAKGNNGIGVVGVAFNAKVMPLKVCDAVGDCFTYEIAEAIIYAADRGAKVINMSLGGPGLSTTVQGAVAYALSRNVTVIAAAGNTGTSVLQYPASYPGVISVGAADPTTGNIASFSTFNSSVTIAAPGVGILSTYPAAGGASTYAFLDGTSMATPHVAGIAALLIAKGSATTPAQIREALICSALDRGAVGRDNFFGHGLVQADYALNWNNNSPNCKSVPVNDTFQGATRITTLPGKIVQPINFRTVTASVADGVVCGNTPTQNVWFSYTPTVSGSYQITTLGSSYDTYLSVVQGNPGSMRCVADNDDFNGGLFGGISHVVVDLQAGQPYFIMVDVVSGAVDNQLLQLNVNPVLMATGSTLSGATENNGTHIAYNGTWITGGVPGASPAPSGGTTAQTSDNNAWALFTVRGYEFEYLRTVGPDQGGVEIYGFDRFGSQLTSLSFTNNAPLRRSNQSSGRVAVDPGTVFTVAIRRDSAGFPGPIDLDRIRVYDLTSAVPTALVSTLSDDRDLTRFRYDGTWTPVSVTGSNANTAYQSLTAGDVVTFQGTGSTLTIWRNMGPGFSDIQVMVDGRNVVNIVNNGPAAQRVPYIITGLSASNHVVRIFNLANATFQFDAAGFSNPTALVGGTANTNENSTSLLYTGTWTNMSRPGALGSTTRQTSQTGAAVDFSFTGNRFCALMATQPGGATVDVYIDGAFVTNWDTSAGTLTFNVPFCSNLLYDGLHRVRLVRTAGTMEIDGIQARRIAVLTPASGVVNESSTAFTYTGTWSTVTNASLGGLRFQGGSARRTTATGATVEFYINGTGFVLFTSFSGGLSGTPLAGDYQILVNGSPITVTLNGVNEGNEIDLDNGWRFMPGGFGITGLPAGINRITLIKIDGNGNVANAEIADFDAIRVFP